MENLNVKRKARARRSSVIWQIPSARQIISATICVVVVLCAVFSFKIAGNSKQNNVYAASETESVSTVAASTSTKIPSGIVGVATGLSTTPSAGSTVSRFGTSYDDVIVGQRTRTISGNVASMNIADSFESTLNDLDSKVVSLASTPKMMSDDDYANLLQIVEAEAGTEDIKGRVLVANVIMNRVKYPEFPDTISDVIWEYDNGVAQFSPVSDGRIGEVTPSSETKEAVKQALEGVDYSEGALFFIQKDAAEANNVTWFETNLKKLFKHGVHEFYTYTDDVIAAATGTADTSTDTAADSSSAETTTDAATTDAASTTATDSSQDLVQMAMAE